MVKKTTLLVCVLLLMATAFAAPWEVYFWSGKYMLTLSGQRKMVNDTVVVLSNGERIFYEGKYYQKFGKLVLARNNLRELKRQLNALNAQVAANDSTVKSRSSRSYYYNRSETTIYDNRNAGVVVNDRPGGIAPIYDDVAQMRMRQAEEQQTALLKIQTDDLRNQRSRIQKVYDARCSMIREYFEDHPNYVKKYSSGLREYLR